MIRHFEDPKIITIYAHNSKNIAKRGFFVEKGEIIAYVGSTGRSTGNHLHFEMRKDEEVCYISLFTAEPKSSKKGLNGKNASQTNASQPKKHKKKHQNN